MVLNAGATNTASYILVAAGATVYTGASVVHCASSDPAIADLDATVPDGLASGLGSGETGTIAIAAHAKGLATVTCTAGSRHAAIYVTVQ